jgi:hypothetical protein
MLVFKIGYPWSTILSRTSEASQGFKSMADESLICEWLHICCEKAWDKLNDYYKLVDESPAAYYTAMVMDPSLKHACFEKRWNGPGPSKSEWISGITEAMVSKHWKQWQKEGQKQRSQEAPTTELHLSS